MSEVEFVPSLPIDLQVQSANQATVNLWSENGVIVIDFSSPAMNSTEVEASQLQPELTIANPPPATTIDILASASIRFEVESAPLPTTSSLNYALLTVEATNQTTLALPTSPKNPHKSELFVNGIKATYGKDYIVDGVVLSWLEPLTLEPSDEIEIIYE